MPKITKVMPSFEAVAAGSTATLRLPIGNTYERLMLKYSGVTLAQLLAIRILANGKQIWKITSLAKLKLMNDFDGRSSGSGLLVVDFMRYGLRLRQIEELTGLGTGRVFDASGAEVPNPNPITTLTLEIDIAAGAANPVLKAKAIQSPASINTLIKHVREYTHTAQAAGVYEVSDLPKTGLVNRIFIGNHGTTAIKSLKIERDSRIVFDRDVDENELLQADGVRVPQAGYVVYDPSEEGYGTEALVTKGVQDLRYQIDVTNAGQIPLTVETLEPLAV